MLLVLLDAFHLGDPLFVPQLARDVAARKEGLVFVHGSGEAGERALEARGVFPEARGGVWPTADAAEAAEVERAARDLNRRIVHEMNEAGAPAVRVMASDRGLVARGADGALRPGKTDWLSTLVGQGGVAVVAAFVAGDAGPLAEVDAAATAAVLAGALGADAVALLVSGRTAGIGGPDGVRDTVQLAEALAGGTLPDAGLAERLVGHLVGATSMPVVATLAARLRGRGTPPGTRIVP